MAFDDLPPQPSINSLADAYIAKAIELSRAAAGATRSLLDIAYGPDYLQRLDVYLPGDRALTGLPVLVFVPGGGWRHGKKEWMGFKAPPIISLPAIFVAISHRHGPEAPYPAPLDDCFRAVRWVKNNIAKLGGDPARIFIGGHSSGGHLSTLVALRGDMAERHGLPRDVIKACLPISGIYDLAYDSSTLQAHTRGSIANFLGGADAVEASPMAHLAGNKTPFFVIWSSTDNEIMKATSPIFVEALRRQPGRVETLIVPGLNHFEMSLAQQSADSPWIKAVRGWMRG
jgi:acetyl esterase/lipase